MIWVQMEEVCVEALCSRYLLHHQMAQTQDEAVVELLELVDQYEKLANDQFRVNFITGMQNLSRANFNSENRKYGVDSYDRRPYEACKIVGCKDGFALQDRLEKLKEEKNKQRELDKPNLNGSEKEVSDDSLSGKPETEKNEPEKSIRNRKNTKLGKKETKSNEDSPALRDPIYQFGVLVPYQLREAQAAFSNSLSDIIEMLNLRQRIERLIAQIEKTSLSK